MMMGSKESGCVNTGAVVKRAFSISALSAKRHDHRAEAPDEPQKIVGEPQESLHCFHRVGDGP
jgi:hypothetical protein